ncbi:NADP-dependent malic enzyme [Alkalihalobacillus sp. TS-13]|uniref:NAD(P)-dependent malic enzyme n=1 Tax=Alkalihalobacillus sp. TS-13 TaxID=2842455 RepID=UPI001C8708B9|nr:malic enzyme-like NAD(P)-binding protein [Alkalihalobacillus sp. TS-13]
MSIGEESLKLHFKHKGKLSVDVKVPVFDERDLSLVYSPGVADPCRAIFEKAERIYDYTIKGNLVGVVSNGSAVLGLGNIGPDASMPVMEGKAALFKLFAGIDAFPICLKAGTAEEVIETVKRLEPTFGGINLEDISAPDCFVIEEKLKKEMNIPVFHDDQHGTAIVTAAGLINALKVVQKSLDRIKVVVNGAGAAGIAITQLLINMGVKDIIMCDSRGAIFKGRTAGMNTNKVEIAKKTNHHKIEGSLSEALKDADVFIGVSVAGALTREMVKSMNMAPIVFAMANPIPEIMPEEAKSLGVAVIGTGRSDYPNQINNVLAFPGIFKGALEASASEINEAMKLAAVYAIADLIQPHELTEDYVIPNPFDKRVVTSVSSAVAEAAIKTGVSRKKAYITAL